MKFRHKFSVVESKPLARPPSGNSRVQQHFKDEVDINNILAKYKKTGVITHVARARKLYGDFTQVKDVAEAMDVSARAKSIFEELPAEIRNRFKNSIPGFFEYIGKEENLEECYKLGIYDRPKAPEPEKVTKVEVVTPSVPPNPSKDEKKKAP